MYSEFSDFQVKLVIVHKVLAQNFNTFLIVAYKK